MYIINQIKYTLIFLLISLLALNGCQTEQYNEFDRVGEIIELEDGKLLVPIALELPVYSVIETKAVGEPIIKNIRVVVYDASGNVIQCVEGKIGSTNNKMEAILQRYNNPCSIQVFANIPDRLLPTFKIGSTSEQINKLILENSDLTVATTAGIPVLSEAKELRVLDPVNITGYTASLKYVCARIDITCNTPGFTLSEVTLINAAKQSTLRENTSSVDLGGEEQRKLSVSNNNIQKIYLFENSEVKAGTTDKNTTDLIVKINNGFYKICINYKNTDQTVSYSIVRGYRYNVIINSVKGPGYSDPDEAKANKPANIDYNITIDDGRSKDIVTSNGSYYLGVTNSEFYLFADEAKGVTVTHLSHNAPATVTNAFLSVSGTGITLRTSEGYTVTTSTTATLNLKNGAVQNLPIKLDLTSASTGGILTIRIGDLVKEIKIVRKANRPDTPTTYDILNSEYDGSDFKTITSLSDRLKISDKGLIMDNSPIYPDRNRVFAYATAFAGETRKNVLIAVKRPAQEVVYYEKYQDNTYGFSYQDGSCSSLDSLKNITEAGYGVLNINPLPSSTITIGGDNSFTVSNTALPYPIWEDYATGAFYPVNQQNIKITKGISNALSVGINGKATSQYVFPLFAKGVYQTSTVVDGVEGKSFRIRTPLHFRNIINVFNSAWKHYLQEYYIDFSNTSIGGITSLTAPVFEYESGFIGCLDGGMKKITGLHLIGANDGKFSSLFEYNFGTIKNIHIVNGRIDGYQHAAFITGVNKSSGKIENCIIEKSCIYNEYKTAGFIAGSNGGTINNCLVIANSIASTNGTKTLYNIAEYTGGIAGQNDGTISNVAVIDTNPLSFNTNTIPIITSGAPDGFMGGIVGNNGGTLTDAVYIARPPQGTYKYPITGNQSNENANNCLKTYYIYNNLNPTDIVGGGTAKPISGFEIGDLDPNHWVCDKINGYPFPRLLKLPKETVPTSWPGKR